MNDRFLRACRRQPVDRPPLWVMRQAGRYLPEYRQLRESVDFLTLCKTPELAAEVTLQPIRRFGFDAAIVFSDILIPVEAMGCPLNFDPGPRLATPVRTRAQVEALSAAPMQDVVPYVGKAIELLRRELKVPLIGFCGAPFTLAAYMVEGEGRQGFGEVKKLMVRDPATLTLLLEKLADAMADYLSFQARAGAQALQVFDSWAGILSPHDYRAFALPGVQRLVRGLKNTGVPLIYFAPAAGHLLADSLDSGAEVLGVCWRTPMDEARRVAAGRVALQGNLDPHVLFGAPDVVRERANAVMDAAGDAPGHVMNLGHGILPDTPIASVEALVDAVASRASRVAGSNT